MVNRPSGPVDASTLGSGRRRDDDRRAGDDAARRSCTTPEIDEAASASMRAAITSVLHFAHNRTLTSANAISDASSPPPVAITTN